LHDLHITYVGIEYTGGKVLQPWRASGGNNWTSPVTFAYLIYWWVSGFRVYRASAYWRAILI